MNRLRAWLTIALAGFAFACGDVTPVAGGTGSGGHGGSAGGGGSAGSSLAGAGGTSGTSGGSDAIGGSAGGVAQCVFVSATLGSVAGAGTREHPAVSIARGIDIARANGLAAVCVSGEIYNEAVTVASGVSVYGGFDGSNASFPFRRSSTAVTEVIA